MSTAAAPASPAPAPAPLGPNEAEVDRIMAICNACRYCEGFCAVFPAMERRLSFAHGDIHLLANLCHNCGACLHACQYAPPNAFDVNVPRSLAAVRATTYEQYAWPAAFGSLYRHQGAWVAFALAVGLALFFFLATRVAAPPPAADFYAVIPHGVMATVFSVVALWVVLAFAIGVRRFWRGLPSKPHPVSGAAAAGDAIAAALTLRNLDGGGDGCNDHDDTPTHRRRRFHHLTFYGFALCFAATSVATLYHYGFGWRAPYPVTSLPVLLGTLGGIGLLIGPAGLWHLHRRRHPLHGDPRQRPMDVAFMGLLFATSATGLLLLVLRATAAMPTLLAVHLGVVMALFLTLPYGKFAHAVYRVTALVKDAIEKRQPNTVALKLD